MDKLIDIHNLLGDQDAEDAATDEQKANVIGRSTGSTIGATMLANIKTTLDKGHDAFFYTNGAWSMYELLVMLCEHEGGAIVYISSYAMSETSARVLAKLKEVGTIEQLYILIDNRVDTRSPGSLQLLQQVADQIVLTSCHAKLTLIFQKEANTLILGSANYSENKRLETGMATRNAAAIEFYRKLFHEQLNQ